MTLVRDKPQGVMHPVREVSINATTRVAAGRTHLLFLNAYITDFNPLKTSCCGSYGPVISVTT